MSTSTLNSAQQPQSTQETCQAIVFAIAGHLFALPLPAVLRVLATRTIPNYSRDLRLVYIEQKPIPVIDLRSFIQPSNTALSKAIASSEPQPFMLLVPVHDTQMIAISIDEAPNLMILTHSTMQALPQAYRQQIGNLASHVAVVEQQNQLLTILLLDLASLPVTNNAQC